MIIPGSPTSLHYGNLVNRASPLNRGLVGWWLTLPQGGKGNTFFDIAGKNHGTLTNGPTWGGALGRPGGFGAITLTAGSYVALGTLSALNGPFTVALWARFTSTNTQQTVFGGPRGTANARMIVFNNFGGSNLTLIEENVAFILNTATALSQNTWYHIAWTFDSNNDNTVYLNAVSDGTANRGMAGNYTGGTNLSDTSTSFDMEGGQQDEICVYDRALSASEVLSLYNESRQGHPQTLNRIRPVRLGVAAVGGTAARARFYALLNVA